MAPRKLGLLPLRPIILASSGCSTPTQRRRWRRNRAIKALIALLAQGLAPCDAVPKLLTGVRGCIMLMFIAANTIYYAPYFQAIPSSHRMGTVHLNPGQTAMVL